MEHNAHTSKDPLNVEALPPTAGMELDSRLPLDPVASAVTLWGLVVTLVCGALMAIALRTLGGFLDSPFVLALLTFLSLGWALDAYTRRRVPPASAAVMAIAGPLIWALIWAVSARAVFAVFFVAFAGILILCNGITNHATRWMHANPTLDPTTRRWLLGQWGGRAASGAMDPRRLSQLRACEAQERREHSDYRRKYVYVIAAAVLSAAVYPVVASPLFAGMAVFFVLGFLLVAIGLFSLPERLPSSSLSLRDQASVCWSAVVSWCWYNPGDLRAPGVFQSPAGSPVARRALGVAVVGALSLSILPAASYFPVAMLASGPAPWLSIEREPWPWERGGWRARGEPAPQRRAPLSEAQRSYADRLSPDGRIAYMDVLSAAPGPMPGQERARRTANLTSSPERWFLFAIRGVVAGEAKFVWAILASLVVSIAAPALLAGFVLFAIAGRRLAYLHAVLEAPGARYQNPEFAENPWRATVARLRSSEFVANDQSGREIRERDHLYVGHSVHGGYPVLLSTGALDEHAHITGDTGSGKTSLGITPMMVQLIERRDPSVLVIDLKGDPAMFQAARHAAEDAGTRFRWFTNVADRSTFLFNPFTQRHILELPRAVRAELFLQSLGLDYGEGYGTHYFSSVHREVLTKVLEARPEIDTFAKLAKQFERKQLAMLGDEIQTKQRDDATHLYAVVNSLAGVPALNLEPGQGPEFDHRIDLSDLRREPEVIYFDLPAMLDSSSVRQIAKLALYCLLTAATRTQGRRVYVFIDEFQQVVSENLEIVLRQARSMGVSCILANQTLSDLRTASANLIPTVQANTRFKQAFSATDLLQQKAMMDASGEGVYELMSETYSPLDGSLKSIGVKETIGPRLRRNDIIAASDDPGLSYMHVTRGDGFTQFGGFPFLVRSSFHIDNETYRRRMQQGWPPPGNGAFVPQEEETVRRTLGKPQTASVKTKTGNRRGPRRPKRPDDFGGRLDAL